MKVNEILLSGIVVGIIAGVLSALPICSYLCEVWLIGGGLLAAYIYHKRVGSAEMTEGVLCGAATGVVATIIWFIMIVLVMTGMLTVMFFSTPLQEAIWRVVGFSLIYVIIISIAILLLYTAWGALGGAIYSFMIKRSR